MKLKFRVPADQKDTIPAAFLEYYTLDEKTGTYTLNVDGAVGAERVAEFRTNNETLRLELEEIAAAATGKTAAEFKGAKKDAILAEIKTANDAHAAAGNAKTKTEVEAAAQARIDALNASHTRAMQTLQTTADARQKELSALKIDAAVLAEATKLGLRPTATEDITFRAGRVFSLGDDGKPVAKDAEGKQIFDLDAQGEPLGIAAWVKKQVTAAPHLFESSEGGGTGGGGAGKPAAKQIGTGPNPWDPKTLNITEQGKIFTADPALARRMAALHGVKIPG